MRDTKKPVIAIALGLLLIIAAFDFYTNKTFTLPIGKGSHSPLLRLDGISAYLGFGSILLLGIILIGGGISAAVFNQHDIEFLKKVIKPLLLLPFLLLGTAIVIQSAGDKPMIAKSFLFDAKYKVCRETSGTLSQNAKELLSRNNMPKYGRRCKIFRGNNLGKYVFTGCYMNFKGIRNSYSYSKNPETSIYFDLLENCESYLAMDNEKRKEIIDYAF